MAWGKGEGGQAQQKDRANFASGSKKKAAKRQGGILGEKSNSEISLEG